MSTWKDLIDKAEAEKLLRPDDKGKVWKRETSAEAQAQYKQFVSAVIKFMMENNVPIKLGFDYMINLGFRCIDIAVEEGWINIDNAARAIASQVSKYSGMNSSDTARVISDMVRASRVSDKVKQQIKQEGEKLGVIPDTKVGEA